jgi:hypothetical protein
MKRWISAVMAVALLVSVAPVLAGDSFHALSRLPAGLSPLDDAQLATVEGGDMTALQSTSVYVSQSTPTSTSIYVSQSTAIHTSQAEWRWVVSQGDHAAVERWRWVFSQGDPVVVQEFLARWLQR